MPAIDCGIDIGSTNVKVVFVADGGRPLLTRSLPSPRVNDSTGAVTDPVALVRHIEDLIIAGWRDLGTDRPLRSITAAGVGEDGVCLDHQLQPLGPAIPWFDRRAEPEAEELRLQAQLIARAGVALDGTRTAAKWLWLHRHRPDELKKSGVWIALTDFPALWWTAEPFMSISLAPRTGCFDVGDRRWIDGLLAAAHAPRLPRLVNAGTIVGRVRAGALRDSGAAAADTAVVAGGHDHPVAATTVQRLDPAARIDSLGTANLVYGETRQRPDLGPGDIAFSIPPSGKPGYACLGVLEFGATLASVLEDKAELKACLAQQRLPGAPPAAAGDLDDAGSDRALKLRRVLERMSFAARHMLKSFDRLGVPPGVIYSTGGWSRSRSFMELRASVFGETIRALGDFELTAIGAALFGAAAVTGQPVRPLLPDEIATIAPDPAWRTAYDAYYRAHDRA